MQIEARGYAKKSETKTSKAGNKRTVFYLSVKQKEKAFGDRPEQVTWANFQVTDFSNTAVPEKAYVTVKGRLKVREEKDENGKTLRTFLDINADSVEVAPPLGDAGGDSPAPASKANAAPEKDPWE